MEPSSTDKDVLAELIADGKCHEAEIFARHRGMEYVRSTEAGVTDFKKEDPPKLSKRETGSNSDESSEEKSTETEERSEEEKSSKEAKDEASQD